MRTSRMSWVAELRQAGFIREGSHDPLGFTRSERDKSDMLGSMMAVAEDGKQCSVVMH